MRLFRKLLPYIFTLCVIATSFYAASQARDIIDWWRLRSYEPSAEVTALATDSGMSGLGRRYFYVHDPALLDRAQFASSCTVGEETIVLGCYITNQRIYLFQVTDERLEGIVEVTAAHEMLHAAYDRLSPAEKNRVNALLDEAYQRLDDERIRENVLSYQARDPSVVSNELHSILGTEVRSLPKDLEAYYAQYFDDRSKVVTLAEQYAVEFQAREEKIQAYDAQLTQINGEISRMQAELKEENSKLTNERAAIEQKKSDVPVYNAAVGVYNKHVATYNLQVNEVKRLIDSYNQIVSLRNEIAVEERELVEAIDTRIDEL